MKLLRSLDELTDAWRGGAVTVGNFDGVHQGHARIVAELCAQARALGGPAVVFTFDPHPVRLLRPQAAPPPLTWTDRKAELLAELGVDAMLAYPTDESLLALTAAEFFDRILRGALRCRALVEGANFCFGRDRRGTVDVLARLAAEAGLTLDVVPPVVLEGDVVSSSRIRRLIGSGNVDEAARLLTRPYRIRGVVRHGAARGARLGFPTANVDGVDTLLPAPGVYAGWARVDGAAHAAAVNVGPNPTFGEPAWKIEAHLLDYQANLYGLLVELDFVSRLRDVRPFASVDELKTQLAADTAETRRRLEVAASRTPSEIRNSKLEIRNSKSEI